MTEMDAYLALSMVGSDLLHPVRDEHLIGFIKYEFEKKDLDILKLRSRLDEVAAEKRKIEKEFEDAIAEKLRLKNELSVERIRNKGTQKYLDAYIDLYAEECRKNREEKNEKDPGADRVEISAVMLRRIRQNAENCLGSSWCINRVLTIITPEWMEFWLFYRKDPTSKDKFGYVLEVIKNNKVDDYLTDSYDICSFDAALGEETIASLVSTVIYEYICKQGETYAKENKNGQ